MKNMYNKLAITIFAAAVLTLPLSAQVAATYRADVPFEFAIGNTTLPAGQYNIQTTSGQLILLRGDNGACYFGSILKSGYDAPAQQSALVFNHYGDRYFLSAVKTTNATREAPTSKQELELRNADVSAVRPSQTKVLLALR